MRRVVGKVTAYHPGVGHEITFASGERIYANLTAPGTNVTPDFFIGLSVSASVNDSDLIESLSAKTSIDKAAEIASLTIADDIPRLRLEPPQSELEKLTRSYLEQSDHYAHVTFGKDYDCEYSGTIKGIRAAYIVGRIHEDHYDLYSLKEIDEAVYKVLKEIYG